MSSRIHSTRCHALNKQKMGTSLCDVTMTLKQQEKIEKTFFLHRIHFQQENVSLTFLPKMHTGLHSGLQLISCLMYSIFTGKCLCIKLVDTADKYHYCRRRLIIPFLIHLFNVLSIISVKNFPKGQPTATRFNSVLEQDRPSLPFFWL